MAHSTKLIVGGVDKVPGFTSVDLNMAADIVADVRLHWSFPDETIETIFSSHLIEHLTRGEALFALYECYRVMKHGGIIRVSTPDLGLFARNYTANNEDFYSQINPVGQARFPGGTIADSFMYVCHGMGHKWLYDSKSLCLLMQEVGFASVEQKSFRESAIPEVNLLDNRPDVSLFVEARKEIPAVGNVSSVGRGKFFLPRKLSLMIRLQFLVLVLKSRVRKVLLLAPKNSSFV